MVRTFERRQGMRVDLAGIVRGAVSLRTGVQVINLGPDGAQIEHAERLFPGNTCLLSLRIGQDVLRVGAEVVWSRVHRVQTLSSKTGEGELHYRAGLRFTNIRERTGAQLRNYLATVSPPR